MSAPDQRLVWLCRVLWLALPLGFVPSLSASLRGAEQPAALGIAVVLWAGWALGLGALFVPSPTTLSGLRIAAPFAVVAAVASLIGGAEVSVGAITAVGLAVVTTLVAMTADVGRAFVQASAYGDETRLALRVPAPLMLPIAFAWLVPATALVGGAATAAHGSWLVGVGLVAAGAAAGYVVVPRMHRLSRRWLVFVPAGVVVHDQTVLAETVMFRTSTVDCVDLARSASEAADLTGVTGGTRVDIVLTSMETVVFAATSADPKGRAIHARSVQVAPTRPGAAVAEARRRGYRQMPPPMT